MFKLILIVVIFYVFYIYFKNIYKKIKNINKKNEEKFLTETEIENLKEKKILTETEILDQFQKSVTNAKFVTNFAIGNIKFDLVLLSKNNIFIVDFTNNAANAFKQKIVLEENIKRYAFEFLTLNVSNNLTLKNLEYIFSYKYKNEEIYTENEINYLHKYLMQIKCAS